MEVKWIKLSSDLFDNRKIKQIRKMPDGDAIIVIWFQILCLAGNQGSKGLVFFANDIPYTEEMLAVEFDRNINTVRLAMNTFIKFGMVEIVDNFILISNWEKYQSADKIESIREYNREKKREQRLKQKETLLQLSQGQCQGQVIDCQDIDILSNSNSSISSNSLSLKEEENIECIQNGYTLDTQVRLGKVSIGKLSIEEDIVGQKEFAQVVEYLNQKTGKKFRLTESTKKLINARLKEKFLIDDFYRVIDNQCSKWLKDEKMIDYLRPQTLFGTKFESYLNSIKKKKLDIMDL